MLLLKVGPRVGCFVAGTSDEAQSCDEPHSTFGVINHCYKFTKLTTSQVITYKYGVRKVPEASKVYHFSYSRCEEEERDLFRFISVIFFF